MSGFWRTCLILLLVVLLPARAWAVAAMAVPPVAAKQAGMTTVMPCHGEGADAGHVPSAVHPGSHAETGAGPDPTDQPASLPEPAHSCASCDLCHTQLAVSGNRVQTLGLPRSDAPAERSARDTGRLLAASLERPPRA